MVRLLALLLSLLVLVPAHAGTPAERAVVRQQLRKGTWNRGAPRWVPATGREPMELQMMGDLRIRSRGEALVIETRAPQLRDGQPGYLVERLHGVRVAGQGVPVGGTAQSFGVTIGVLGWQHLAPIKLPDLYHRALDQIAAKHPTASPEIYESAMDGAATGIDRWTRHISKKEWASFATPSKTGIGVGIGHVHEHGGVVLQSVFPKSPAWLAGLRRGDRIVSIDGVAPTSTEHTIELFAGDGPYRVTWARGTKQTTGELGKGSYPATAVRSSLRRGGVGVVRLSAFGAGASDALMTEIDRLATRNGGSLRGLVLDLRGNAGGFVEEAIQMLQGFIPAGELAEFKDAHGTVTASYQADPTRLRHPTLPLVVLIDHESASASELVAGSLKGRRAVVLGETSFGKGVQQASVELADGSALNFTNAQFFTQGSSPHLVGVVPTVARATTIARARARDPHAVDPILQQAIATLSE